jgi:hypothetical protein
MPIIHYLCECKHSTKKFYRKPKEAPDSIDCILCQCKAARQLSAPSSKSTVTVDNGFQARAVEVTPEIIEINEKRSEKDYREN